ELPQAATACPASEHLLCHPETSIPAILKPQLAEPREKYGQRNTGKKRPRPNSMFRHFCFAAYLRRTASSCYGVPRIGAFIVPPGNKHPCHIETPAR
ncbi:MAG: hypothetical protein O7D30_03385, partial [Rickettsia endosymbiont of Ixodes persulcatus]|nr:hypothetical protein [Rickettsia endosymbiont of Ixodes persulcatus]